MIHVGGRNGDSDDSVTITAPSLSSLACRRAWDEVKVQAGKERRG